jgi:glycerol-3-phosphate dehydrogenase
MGTRSNRRLTLNHEETIDRHDILIIGGGVHGAGVGARPDVIVNTR